MKIEPRQRQGVDYGESKDVQQVHAAIRREKPEPRLGLEPLSIWLIAIYAIAIFFGGAYLGRFSGNFNGESLDPGSVPTVSKGPNETGPGAPTQTELTPFERGKKVFMANCAVCHQATGLGAAGQGYPPLAGSEFTNEGSVRAAMIVLKGLQGPVTVKGQKFGSAVMQPWETLGDQKVADVLTYERSEWGNKGTPVTKEQIAEMRKKLAGHPASFTEPELLATPNEDIPGGQPGAGAANTPGAQPPKP
jgi:mono/diheme cytochrome c family protein